MTRAARARWQRITEGSPFSAMAQWRKGAAVSKRIPVVALAFVGALACTLQAAPRTVLYEHFTAFW
jgi:hypothetical protein